MSSTTSPASTAQANRARPFQLAAAVLLIAFGIGTALASVPLLAEPTRLFVDFVIWPLDGKQSLASPETRLLAAILGGVLTGWGVTLWQFAALAASDRPSTSGQLAAALRSGLIAWFVVDSTGSVLAGAPVNAAVNIAILAALLLTLRQIQER